mgnify:CR=1 FL=1
MQTNVKKLSRCLPVGDLPYDTDNRDWYSFLLSAFYFQKTCVASFLKIR